MHEAIITDHSDHQAVDAPPKGIGVGKGETAREAIRAAHADQMQHYASLTNRDGSYRVETTEDGIVGLWAWGDTPGLAVAAAQRMNRKAETGGGR